MNIAFFVYHPVEPHFYRYIAETLKGNGHNIFFFVLVKEGIETKILEQFNIKYQVIGKNRKTLVWKLISIPAILLRIIFNIKKNKIDIVVSATSPYVSKVKKLLNIKFIGFTDTETATFNNKKALADFDSVLTPDCFQAPIPQNKHIKFNSYKEFAYLHPNWFTPDDSILTNLGIKQGEKIVLMRFSELKAMHDIGLKSVGDNKTTLLRYIKEIEKHARVFISMTEKDLGKEFDKYKLDINPADYIHLLAYCTLYIGEGTTTASEAGVLGIPWINIQKTTRGYLIDQEENYKLGFRTDDIDHAFKIALEWIQDEELQIKWEKKRDKLLKDKIDVSAFLSWFIENYPESHKIMKENPDYQERFR